MTIVMQNIHFFNWRTNKPFKIFRGSLKRGEDESGIGEGRRRPNWEYRRPQSTENRHSNRKASDGSLPTTIPPPRPAPSNFVVVAPPTAIGSPAASSSHTNHCSPTEEHWLSGSVMRQEVLPSSSASDESAGICHDSSPEVLPSSSAIRQQKFKMSETARLRSKSEEIHRPTGGDLRLCSDGVRDKSAAHGTATDGFAVCALRWWNLYCGLDHNL
jgi:hypothetical protein